MGLAVSAQVRAEPGWRLCEHVHKQLRSCACLGSCSNPDQSGGWRHRGESRSKTRAWSEVARLDEGNRIWASQRDGGAYRVQDSGVERVLVAGGGGGRWG